MTTTPLLVIHGDDDHVLPYAKTGARLAGLIGNVQTVVIAGGPHAIAWTHADRVQQRTAEVHGLTLGPT